MVIYIGYDSQQPEAYEVCKESILRYNRSHVIKPLIQTESTTEWIQRLN